MQRHSSRWRGIELGGNKHEKTERIREERRRAEKVNEEQQEHYAPLSDVRI